MVTGGIDVPGGIQRVPGVPGVEDPVRLAKWMAGAGLADLGELRAGQLISGGGSNPPSGVDLDGGQIVLRRPPLGHVLPTAHDMSREYRVLAALAPTNIPVPVTIAFCADTEILGSPFYVMEKVDGEILRTPADLARLSPTDARRCS